VVLSRLISVLLLLALAGCGNSAADAPESISVTAGFQKVAVRPSQYCLDGEGRRYTTRPPVIEASPGSPIVLTVPDSVADRGWSVQVFDEKLEKELGVVDVPKGTAVYDEISTDDVVPPAFYLVIVENKGGDCGQFSGAWPVAFIRAGGSLGGTPSSGTPSSSAPAG
jgi:ABC-type Fe3+-hydroxamate transport system substrate-binding protein